MRTAQFYAGRWQIFSGVHLLAVLHGADVGELARLQPRLPDGVPHAVAVAVVAQLLLL